MSIFRPSEAEISAHYYEALTAYVRNAFRSDIEDAIVGASESEFFDISKALRADDMTELGRAIFVILETYEPFIKQARSAAEQWADSVETIEREKAARS